MPLRAAVHFGDCLHGPLPPSIEGVEGSGPLIDETGLGFDQGFKLSAIRNSRSEVDIVLVARRKEGIGLEAQRGEELLFSGDLRSRDAAGEVGVDVLGLGRGRVVGVAADVEVVVVVALGVEVDDGGEAAHRLEALVGRDDLLDVLRLEVVLGATFVILAVGVDEENLLAASARLA